MSTTIISLFVCFFAFIAFSSSQNTGCNQIGAMNAGEFLVLWENMQNAAADWQKQEIIQNAAWNQTAGFNSTQVVMIMESFDNEIIMEEVIFNISSYILGMYCEDVLTILSTFQNTILQIEILPLFVNYTIDLKENNQTIVMSFVNTFQQKEAQQIIDAAVPISCVWGDVTKFKSVIFVIDSSGSMSTVFIDSLTGNKYTRFGYVLDQLTNILQNVLTKYQSFNVIVFSDYAHTLFAKTTPVSTSSVNAAITWVNTFSPNGGTNMLGALNSAYSDPTAKAVVLLSDGQPNCCQSNIISAAQTWSKSSTPSNPTNTISFQAGGTYDPAAAAFMQQIADVTGGVYRSVN